MTDTARAATPSTQSPRRTKRRRVWLPAVGLLAGVLVIVCVAVFGVSSSSGTGAIADQQLASVQRACQEWSGGHVPTLGDASATYACTNMANWMSQQMRNGRMTAPMMWGSTSAMAATCRTWVDTSSRFMISGTASPAWCDEMVGWMEQHIGNWGDWMMSGNMMGG